MASLMFTHIEIRKEILSDPQYRYLFSVEEVNKLVVQGIPFRDAYKKVGIGIEQGEFSYSPQVNHSHEGSIGNLQNNAILHMMESVVQGFNFNQVNMALEQLLS